MSKILILCFSFLLLTACGGDSDNHSNDLTQQQEENGDNFTSRLESNLLVSGENCRGGETTDYLGQSYTCNGDQWLIVIDQVNTCTSEGLCTEIAVPSFVAKLNAADVFDFPDWTYYNIEPVSPVYPGQADIISKIRIRFNLDGTKGEAVYR